MAYFLSPALVKLRAEINALWPHRDKASDGWIGDASHAARPSDHNPDYSDGGIVRAIDVDEDLVAGLTASGEAMPLVNQILRDVRTRYVIYEGRIWTRDTGRWSTYTGPNAHRHHIHVSVRSVGNYDRDARSWGITRATSGGGSGGGGGGKVPSTPGGVIPTPPKTKLVVDGKLGPATVKAWQKAEGTKVDGKISTPDSSLIRAVQASINARNAERKFLSGGPLKVTGRFTTRDRIAFVKYLNELNRRHRFLTGAPLSTKKDLTSSRRNRALQKALNLGLIK